MEKSLLFRILLANFLVALIFSSPARAHHGAEASISGARLAGPIITLPALTLPKKRFYIGAGMGYTNFDRFDFNQRRAFNRKRIHSHNNGDILSPFISGGYGITDDLSLILTMPYVIKLNVQSTINGITLNQGDAIGFGDLTAIAQYRFYKNKKHGLHMAAIAGIKIPTGDTNDKDGFGVKIAADDQAGTGSWDPIMGLAVSKEFKHLSAHASGVYKLATEGSQNTVSGDLVSYGFALAHRVEKNNDYFLSKVFPQHLLGSDLDWDLVMEMNGQWSENVQVNGSRDNNHGGNLLYLTPGLRMILNEKWVANVAPSIQVLSDLSGKQSDPEFQLTFSISRVF